MKGYGLAWLVWLWNYLEVEERKGRRRRHRFLPSPYWLFAGGGLSCGLMMRVLSISISVLPETPETNFVCIFLPGAFPLLLRQVPSSAGFLAVRPLHKVLELSAVGKEQDADLEVVGCPLGGRGLVEDIVVYRGGDKVWLHLRILRPTFAKHHR